jgi:glucose/mannose transport system substrate-binding protein
MLGKRFKVVLTTLAALGLFMTNVQAGEVEVLHWWTSGGEAKSVAVLKQLMEKEGHSWKDFAVAGGGGDNAMTVLKSRVISGDAPAAAQIKGPTIQEWGDEGVLTNLDSVANANNWDELLPSVVSKVMKYKGHYVATPVNVHRVNWMWVNPEVFRKAGATIPTTWAQFEVAAKKIKQAGFIPVARGGQNWQDATLFESIVLGVGGADFYNRAFVKLDSKALNSKTMIRAFDTFRMVKKYTDKDAPGRDWNIATAMVINGKAAMQFMGDWAKGEFLAAKKSPGTDFVCVAAPQTSGMYTFNIDSFAMFKVKGSAKIKAQKTMAKLIMGSEFQETFNLNKGSIPARLGVSRAKFDSCAHDSMDAFLASSSSGELMPSMAHGMSTFSAIQGAIYDVVTKFYSSNMSSKAAAKEMAMGVQSAQ